MRESDPVDRRQTLQSLGSFLFLTALVPKSMQGSGGGHNPDCIEDDRSCGRPKNGTGWGYYSDGDCSSSGSDQDCGFHTGTAAGSGQTDNDCSMGSSSFDGKDADCGIGSGFYSHSDEDCGLPNSAGGGTNTDNDCGKQSGPAHEWTDQDCPTPAEDNSHCGLLDLSPSDPPDPPWDYCSVHNDNPPPAGWH